MSDKVIIWVGGPAADGYGIFDQIPEDGTLRPQSLPGFIDRGETNSTDYTINGIPVIVARTIPEVGQILQKHNVTATILAPTCVEYHNFEQYADQDEAQTVRQARPKAIRCHWGYALNNHRDERIRRAATPAQVREMVGFVIEELPA